MSKIVSFRPSTVPGEDDARIRQDVVDSLHLAIRDAGRGLQTLPTFVEEAFEREVWKHPRKLDMGMVEAMPFHEFVTSPYPRGLDTTIPIIKALLAASPEKGAAERAVILIDKAMHGDQKHGGDRRSASATNVDNIHVGRPTGTSAQAAVRRLRKAAEAGDTKAATILSMVEAGEMKPNAAAIEMGWRKKTRTIVEEPAPAIAFAIELAGAPGTAAAAWDAMTPQERAAFIGPRIAAAFQHSGGAE